MSSAPTQDATDRPRARSPHLRPPTPMFSPEPDSSDSEDGNIGVYWMDDPTPPPAAPAPAPFIVGTPWLNASHIASRAASAHADSGWGQADSTWGPGGALPLQTGSGWDEGDALPSQTGSGWGDEEPVQPGPLFSFTLPNLAGVAISGRGDDADDDGSPERSLMDLEDAVDTSDWEPLYLTFVVATRTCALRRVAVGLPPAPCSRFHACDRCLRLPGANPPAGYWLMMSDDDVERRIRDGGYDIQFTMSDAEAEQRLRDAGYEGPFPAPRSGSASPNVSLLRLSVLMAHIG